MGTETEVKRVTLELSEAEADKVLQARIQAAAPKPADFKKLPLAEQKQQLRRLGVKL